MSAPRTKVIFMGTPAFAVPSLLTLLNEPALYEVCAVVTQPDRPAGRGRKLTASAVRACAEAHHVPVLTPKRMRTEETRLALDAFGAKLFVVAAYGRILPLQLLQLPALGCINVHASLLPRFRGASPIARAIWAGDAQAGVCIMGMEEGMDTGPVYARAAVNIDPHETCGALTERLAALGAAALRQALPNIVAGTAVATPQPDEGISHAPPLRKEDGLLDFAQPAQTLRQQVLALSPWPGTYTFMEHLRLGIVGAEVADCPTDVDITSAVPGEVVHASALGLWVACGTGFLRITEVKPAGRGQMSAAAWISGRGAKKGAILRKLPDTGG